VFHSDSRLGFWRLSIGSNQIWHYGGGPQFCGRRRFPAPALPPPFAWVPWCIWRKKRALELCEIQVQHWVHCLKRSTGMAMKSPWSSSRTLKRENLGEHHADCFGSIGHFCGRGFDRWGGRGVGRSDPSRTPPSRGSSSARDEQSGDSKPVTPPSRRIFQSVCRDARQGSGKRSTGSDGALDSRVGFGARTTGADRDHFERGPGSSSRLVGSGGSARPRRDRGCPVGNRGAFEPDSAATLG